MQRQLLFLTPFQTVHANEFMAGLLSGARSLGWRVRAACTWETVSGAYRPDAIVWSHPLGESSAFRKVLKETPNILLGTVDDELARMRLAFDETAAGNACAEFFIKRGFRALAYASGRLTEDNEPRFAAMRARVLASRDSITLRRVSSEREVLWFSSDSQAAKVVPGPDWMNVWLSRLPKPVAVVCRSDQTALRLLERCQRLGISVPEQVSLLGMGNDKDVSENAEPRISSLDYDFHALGVEAMNLIHRQVDGEQLSEVQLIPVGEIIERESTAVVGVADPLVLRVAQYIQNHLSEQLSVNLLADFCGVSRATLSNRFRLALGRSPGSEIKRQRLALAKTLLAETSLAIKEIGHQCGMPDPYHFSAFFRREAGASPKQWRAHHRN